MSSTDLVPDIVADDDEDRLAVDVADEAEDDADREAAGRSRRVNWWPLLRRAVVSVAVLLAAAGCGYLKWCDGSARLSRAAAAESVHAASDSMVAILSYRPDNVEAILPRAADRLTGAFRDEYRRLIDDVVIPGAKQEHISAVATVPAASSVSANGKHAVALVFVNQTTTIANDPPTNTSSSVRVTLDKVHDRWLISQFDPV